MDKLKEIINDLPREIRSRIYMNTLFQLDPAVKVRLLASMKTTDMFKDSNLFKFAVHTVMGLEITYNINDKFKIDTGGNDILIYNDDTNLYNIIDYVFTHSSIKKTINISVIDLDFTYVQPEGVGELYSQKVLNFVIQNLTVWSKCISLKVGNNYCPRNIDCFIDFLIHHPIILDMVTELEFLGDDITKLDNLLWSGGFPNVKKLIYHHGDNTLNERLDLFSNDIPEIIYIDESWEFPLDHIGKDVAELIAEFSDIKFQGKFNISLSPSFQSDNPVPVIKNEYVTSLISGFNTIDECNTLVKTLKGYDSFEKMHLALSTIPFIYLLKEKQFPFLKSFSMTTGIFHSAELLFLPKSIEDLSIRYTIVDYSDYWTPSENLKYLTITDNNDVSKLNKKDGIFICQSSLLKCINLEKSSIKHLHLVSYYSFKPQNVFMLGELPLTMSRVQISTTQPICSLNPKWLVGVGKIKSEYNQILFKFSDYYSKINAVNGTSCYSFPKNVTFIEEKKLKDLDPQQLSILLSDTET